MKFASVLSAAVLAVSAMSMPARAASEGVTLYCGIEGSAKVGIKALNESGAPRKCTGTCYIKDKNGQSVEVKVPDKALGTESTYQTLFEQEMSDGPYTPTTSFDYSCSAA